MKYVFTFLLAASQLPLWSQVSTPVDTTEAARTIELESVTVSGQRNTYKVDRSETVARLPLRDLENPQVYHTITKTVLRDQVVTNLNNALRNATGVTRLWESTGRGGDGAEYYSLRGFSIQPTLLNGLAGINNGSLDPANIENIEVIKGPSGTLFGGNLISYGGLINITTKRPYEQLGGEFGYVLGSNGLNRITADINTPLSDGMALRVNAAYHAEESFQQAGFNRSLFLAPSLSVKASEKLSFLFNTEIKSSEAANAPMIFLSRFSPLSFNSMELFNDNYFNAYTSDALTIRNPNLIMQAQAIYQLRSNWSSQTVLSRAHSKTDGYYHYLWDSANGDQFTRFISRRNGETHTTNLQQNFQGDFKLAGLRNRIVIGFDYLHKQIDNSSSGWVANGTVSLKNQTDSGVLSPQGVDALLTNSTEGISTAETTIYSVYFSDVINFTPSLSAMLSLRLDNFSGQPNYWTEAQLDNQLTLSPKLGLVYQAIPDKLSLFANYMNGFVNVDPAEVSDINGQNPVLRVFDPEQANQWEAGVKASLIGDKLTATASVYDITVSNKVMVDPENPNNLMQGGEVISQGIECSLVSSPINGLSLIAGFSHNRSEVTIDAADGGYLGMRPEEAGPATLVNFWAHYKHTRGFFKNWALGLGANHGSEHLTLNRSTTGTFALPAYTVYNAVIAYQSDRYSLSLKIDNLTDVRYFSGWSTVTPQRPRWVSLGLQYKF